MTRLRHGVILLNCHWTSTFYFSLSQEFRISGTFNYQDLCRKICCRFEMLMLMRNVTDGTGTFNFYLGAILDSRIRYTPNTDV